MIENKKFKIGSKVIITGNDEFEIGGIHNFCTDIYLKQVFNMSMKFDKCFLPQIEGEIYLIGNYNMYVIKDKKNKKYIFCNDYDEMRLNQTEKEKKKNEYTGHYNSNDLLFKKERNNDNG